MGKGVGRIMGGLETATHEDGLHIVWMHKDDFPMVT